MSPPELCPCGHVLDMCHRENAALRCPPTETVANRDHLARENERLREALEQIRDHPRAPTKLFFRDIAIAALAPGEREGQA